MKITRLRLLGFKSFVEPIELLVEPGLTGVVGPNGCGKSNLLEALRWVMGETSYKTMRASAMEDVIFAGTTSRPARNMAEVTIFIDNSARKAPAEFNDTDTLEVSRRIERDAGSAYKVNGRDVRARDVRLLFEDAATGARSPALVRQGRIGEIVNARPQERRRVLEDAAGIAGLHSRRHEAELRLKATEGNLDRLQDLMGQLATQLQGLKRQARQAKRYKEISGKIRAAEALHYHVLWAAACALVAREEEALDGALREVARLTQAESEALRAQGEAADALPPLREAEAARAAALHRLTVDRDALEREAARAQERQDELRRRLAQLESDLEREGAIMAEAREVLSRLDTEEVELADADVVAAEALPKLQEAARACAGELAQAESRLAALTQESAEARARRDQLASTILEQETRITRLDTQLAELAARADALSAEIAGAADFDALRAEVARAADTLAALEADALAAEATHAAARAEEATAREEAARARLAAQGLETEMQTLAKLLKPAEGWPPVLDQVRATPGYERALGAALGEDLEAPADARAPAHWAGAAPAESDPTLPEGAEPLSRQVSAPPVLARRLAQIGVVERGAGQAMQARLAPGQRLVSRQGDMWRWDGYTAAAEAPTAATQRLAERNRLDELTARAARAREAWQAAQAAHAAKADAARMADAEDRRLRQERRGAQAALDGAREALAAAEHAAQESHARLAALAEARARTEDGLAEARTGLVGAQATQAELPPTEALEAALERHKALVAERREADSRARAALDNAERERALREQRRATLTQERVRWRSRLEGGEAQAATLRERAAETRAELDALSDLPVRIAARRDTLLNEIGAAETARQAAADALAQGETALKACDAALREAQGQLAQAREARAATQARLESARQRRAEQAKAIRDHLDCAPEDCLELAGVKPDATLPGVADIEARIGRLRDERERLGGVNLRAEEEAEQVAEQLADMEAEKLDLEQAVARLRQGISSLNREGRQRLLAAFDAVNAHFQNLFQTLFAGGTAELQLVDADDPLESGLEIFVAPPGKKPQAITLLSGGEKALTALALIFAVFLTNPSPICVLDEVDAPLDDSNVERFCNMMDEMRRVTDTRFIIITHHPMTMARMDRLFGVTMAERGVSQIVSVDLETAERYREAG